MKKWVLAVAAALLVTRAADAGPVRNFVAKHRPGVLVPKGGSCGAVPSSASVAQTFSRPAAAVFVAGCAGGSCPIKK